jgi:predicted O-methyltransferase YrrM
MEFFINLKQNNYELIEKNSEIKYINDEINLINNLQNKINVNNNKDIQYINKLLYNIEYKNKDYIYELLNIDFKIFNNIKDIEKGKKYDNVICDNNDIILLYDILNKKSNVLYINIRYNIDNYYILQNMFENIIIYNAKYIYCNNFNPIITKKEIISIINKQKKIKENNIINEYIEYNLKYINKILNLLLENKQDECVNLVANQIISSFKFYNIKKYNKFRIEYNFTLIKNFKSVYINEKIIKINSNINNNEGIFLKEIIKKYKFKKCLEIGMACGTSAFYMLSNKKIKLISIDPYQDTQWKNIGKNLLKYYEMDIRHKLYLEKSYNCLPYLLKKYGNEKFNLIFIDGWHTFDYTLLDFFYSNLLLKKNGIIIIDDALHEGVKKCVNYINTNYNYYKKIDSPKSFAVFQKIDNDTRDWNFHKNF